MLKTSDKVWQRMRKDPAFFADHLLASGPHPGQRKWLNGSTKNINVLVPGNRWGKTYVIAMKHIHHAMFKIGAPPGLSTVEWMKYPYHTVSTAPSFDQAGLAFKAMKLMLATEAMKPLVKKWRATPYPAVEFWNGSVIDVRSLHDDARYVDGHAYRYLSVDEAGWIPNLKFLINSVLLMRLAGGGSIDLIGTPKGRNDLFWYYRQGELGKDGYYSQRGSIFDNPYLPEEDLKMRERLLSSSDPRLRDQVLYGEFIDFEGLAFTGDQLDNAFRPMPEEQEPIKDHRYITAWDLGRVEDWTVGITIDISRRPWEVVRYDRLQKVPWEQIYSLIEDVRSKYSCQWAVIDATGPGGDVVEEEMLKRRIPIDAVKTNTKNLKLSLINGVQDAFDHGREVVGEYEVLDHDGVLHRRPRLQDPLQGDWGLLRIPEAMKQLRSELEIYMLDDKKLVQDSVFALALAVASARDSEYLAKPAMGGLYYGGEI